MATSDSIRVICSSARLSMSRNKNVHAFATSALASMNARDFDGVNITLMISFCDALAKLRRKDKRIAGMLADYFKRYAHLSLHLVTLSVDALEIMLV